jgi:DNA uptake protein ComE-like DNA-binding protein
LFFSQQNMYKIKIILIVSFIQIIINGHAQNNPDQLLQQKIEDLTETSAGDLDLSDLRDEMETMKERPINLNITTKKELRKLSFLTEKQIDNFILYKEMYGEIFSINELQAVNGFDSVTLNQIKPFVTIRPTGNNYPLKVKELFTKGHGEFVFRYQQCLQHQQGYSVPDSILRLDPDAGYYGMPQKYYFRFGYNYHDRLVIGLSGEKDPGEQFFKGSQSLGMDYYAGYLSLKNAGILKNLVIGNFHADFGQGLTISTAASFRPLPSQGMLRRHAGRIRPSLSVNENVFFRGIGASISLKNIEISAFYSRHNRDANIMTTDSLSGMVNEVSSFQETGYHRIPSEIKDKNAINEMLCGGNIQFQNAFLSLGITGSYSQWSARYAPKKEVYSQYSFTGLSNMDIGLDYQFIYRSIFGFGEISRSWNGGLAWLSGIEVNPDPNLRFSVIYRDYQRSYQNLFGNAIGQNSKNVNEKGVIVNAAIKLFAGISISAYMDLFRFPWLKYRTDLISSGSEFSLQADFTQKKNLIMYLRYRIKNSQINGNVSQNINKWIDQQVTSCRYQVDWIFNDNLQFRNRIEMMKSSGENRKSSYGYFVSQDIKYKSQKSPVSFSFRYALFDTDSYDVRIYAYEDDVIFSTSAPGLDGQGIRCYLLADYGPFQWLDLCLRYSFTFYSDRNVIGTGLEMINGNIKSELKIQMRVKF